MIEHITDHEDRALTTLLSQWQDSPKLKALLAALIGRVQEMEDDAWALATQRALTVAVGAQLDQLGRIVGQSRGGFTDADYRKLINVRIIANRGGGRAVVLLQVVAILVAAPVKYEVNIDAPAEFRLRWIADPPTAEMLAILRRIIGDMVPSGVKWEAVDARAGSFRFGSGTTYGFGVGKFAHKIEG